MGWGGPKPERHHRPRRARTRALAAQERGVVDDDAPPALRDELQLSVEHVALDSPVCQRIVYAIVGDAASTPGAKYVSIIAPCPPPLRRVTTSPSTKGIRTGTTGGAAAAAAASWSETSSAPPPPAAAPPAAAPPSTTAARLAAALVSSHEVSLAQVVAALEARRGARHRAVGRGGHRCDMSASECVCGGHLTWST